MRSRTTASCPSMTCRARWGAGTRRRHRWTSGGTCGRRWVGERAQAVCFAQGLVAAQGGFLLFGTSAFERTTASCPCAVSCCAVLCGDTMSPWHVLCLAMTAQIQEIVQHLFGMAAPRINPRRLQYCFELLGLDFMVDANGQAYLIEVRGGSWEAIDWEAVLGRKWGGDVIRHAIRAAS